MSQFGKIVKFVLLAVMFFPALSCGPSGPPSSLNVKSCAKAMCAAPPTGCHYEEAEDPCNGSCGRLVCDRLNCPTLNCPRTANCRYSDWTVTNSCPNSCGTLTCGDPNTSWMCPIPMCASPPLPVGCSIDRTRPVYDPNGCTLNPCGDIVCD
jgi:hypothetical protein